jgi:hypothetical protein
VPNLAGRFRCVDVSYSVIFAVDVDPVPPAAGVAFQQIAEAISGIPPSSPFFSSIDESVLQIDVEGFRFGYRIDTRHREIVVIECAPLRRR